jgi:hypothetical protein
MSVLLPSMLAIKSSFCMVIVTIFLERATFILLEVVEANSFIPRNVSLNFESSILLSRMIINKHQLP